MKPNENDIEYTWGWFVSYGDSNNNVCVSHSYRCYCPAVNGRKHMSCTDKCRYLYLYAVEIIGHPDESSVKYTFRCGECGRLKIGYEYECDIEKRVIE